MSGRMRRSLRSLDLYSSTVWLRFIIARMRSEPDCTGRCRWLTSSGTSSYTWISASENSTGWLVV